MLFKELDPLPRLLFLKFFQALLNVPHVSVQLPIPFLIIACPLAMSSMLSLRFVDLRKDSMKLAALPQT